MPNLSSDDVAMLRSMPISIVATAAAVEVEDGGCTMGEILAGIRGIIGGAESFPQNGLITAAFEAYKMDGAGEAELLAVCQSAPPDLATSTLDLCRQASARLARREDDWAGFAGWLRDLAIAVVAASTAGGLLGIGGERVTKVESTFLAELTTALRATAA